MKRYQVYLNPNSVSVLDDFEDITEISRSAVIRMTVNSLSQNLKIIIPEKENSSGGLDEIIGIIKTKSKKATNISQRIDDIYYGK